MRAGIAARMTESKLTVPHFYVETEIEIAPALELIEYLNETAEDGDARVTVTALLVRGCAVALREQPRLNAVWTPDGLLEAEDVNVGVAVALDEGLLAPAVLAADGLDLRETAAAVADVAERARAGKLRPAELGEATFTISNLGMFEITSFAAIVPPPQVAILATGRPQERLGLQDGEVVGRRVMHATLSADHRAVDGVDAARFLATLTTCFGERLAESMSGRSAHGAAAGA
jgi:pyruvate dehydrogenase E2 component (dihydrolipoamide acetyltransferase)